jgi:hypothetical protein
MEPLTSETFKAEVSQFRGTENYYAHPLVSRFVWTDGVQYVAERAGAFWLVDLIAVHQPTIRRHAQYWVLRAFQFWHLEVKTDRSAVLRMPR